MRGMGYSESQIIKYLNLSVAAFRMMDSRATIQVESYLRYLMKSGYIQNVTNALIIQWKNVYALQKRAIIIAKSADQDEKSTKYAYAEAHIRNALNNAIMTVSELQEKTPAIAAFNQFINENIIQKNNDIPTSNKLSVFPKNNK